MLSFSSSCRQRAREGERGKGAGAPPDPERVAVHASLMEDQQKQQHCTGLQQQCHAPFALQGVFFFFSGRPLRERVQTLRETHYAAAPLDQTGILLGKFCQVVAVMFQKHSRRPAAAAVSVK